MAFIFLFQSKMLVTMKSDIYTTLNKIVGTFIGKTNEKSRPDGRLADGSGRRPDSAEIFDD